MLGAALACAAFALLNNGGWQEFVAVFLAAACGLGQRTGRIAPGEIFLLDLEAGEIVPGAELVRGDDSLALRVA